MIKLMSFVHDKDNDENVLKLSIGKHVINFISCFCQFKLTVRGLYHINFDCLLRFCYSFCVDLNKSCKRAK